MASLNYIDQGVAVVRDVQPVADVGAVAINRQRFAFERVDNHQRNQFFRMLIRAVVVRTIGDQRWHPVGSDERAYQMIARRLARGVGRARAVRRGFRECPIGWSKRAVHLIGRDVEEACAVGRQSRTPGMQRGVQQSEGSEHVGLQKGLGIGDGSVDVGLGCQMDNAREPVFLEQAAHQIRVADIALDENNAAVGDQGLEAADIGRIGHGVDHDHAVGRPRPAPGVHEILADETGTPRDQNALHPNLRRGVVVGRILTVNSAAWAIAGRKYVAGLATAIRSRKARFGVMFEHDARCQVRQGYQRERHTARDASGEQEDESQRSIDLPVTVDQIALGAIGEGLSF
jgi:hypothetical protein